MSECESHQKDPGTPIALPNGRALANDKQFAALLGMSDRWVREETRYGRIPCRRLGDRVRYLLPDDLDAYLNSVCDPGDLAA